MINKIREEERRRLEMELGVEEKRIETIGNIVRDVIREGLNKMLTDLPPKNVSVLLKTIQAMFRENPEFVCNFIVQVLKKGSNISQEEEQRIKEIRGHYIS